jgi:mono/diheme cytochrome c family protein
MNELTGLLINDPLPARINEGLLFSAFFLHLVFVLAMIGTALISLTYFILERWEIPNASRDFHSRVMRPFIVLEAFAVVLGVAPLLLIQVGFTVSFFTAVTFLGRYWIAIILLIIAALLLLDLYENRIEHSATRSIGTLALAVLGLLLLLAIPGIFVAALVIAENPQQWATVTALGGRVPGELAWLWLGRYLHVLGAAVFVGAGFQYLRTSDSDRARTMLMWMIGSVLYQAVIGMVLLTVLVRGLSWITVVVLGIAILAVMIGTFALALSMGMGKPLAPTAVAAIMLAILFPMLLTRQSIQDRGFWPVRETSKKAAAEYARDLQPYSEPTLAAYQARLQMPTPDGAARYATSCQFCHGPAADGRGNAAADLAIPPESIRDVRTTRPHLNVLVMNGSVGTAMSNFRFYTPAQREQIFDFLNQNYHVFSPPEPVTQVISANAWTQATVLWANTCSNCHGKDGRGSKFGLALAPPPPDFSQYSLRPAAMVRVIKDGYAGTAMPAYPDIPEEVRWALAKMILSRRVAQP